MNQLAINFAADAGQLGMERAASRANREHPGWTEEAFDALRECVSHMPADEEFIIEDVRTRIGSAVPTPRELRSWGQVTQMAIRRNVIVSTGGYKRAVSSNASPKQAYRRGEGLHE